MTTDMAPPPSPSTSMAPPPPPTTAIATSTASEPPIKTLDEQSTSKLTPMGPPPPKTPTTAIPSPPDPEEEEEAPRNDDVPQHPPLPSDSEPTIETSIESSTPEELNGKEGVQKIAVPYAIPQWSEPPCHRYSLEVLKDGSIVDQLHVYEKGAYMFGRVDLCDFVLDHPTISRFHAVIQFKRSGEAYLYDLGSTHGTSINKNQVKKKAYVELHVGDVIRFGHSSRLYIFQGPSELMPPERNLKSVRSAKMRAEMKDMEASLLRAKREAALADGISWGMDEDAVEEAEEDVDEITWQSYKGQLTEKQEKTREKVIKRLEKIANMKKEIDAIRVKDISQGGLTQGQQTQIARNEQRMSQIMEELENLEETLNESIRESLGARGGRTSLGRTKGATEEEEEYLSDDDEFYDRTKKPSKAGLNKSIETADSLLDKKYAITKEMEEKKKLLENENELMTSEKEKVAEAGDALDAFMSGLSSQLVTDTTSRLQTELSNLQSELDRILYLLNIADPTGEASRKRELKAEEQKPSQSQIPTLAVSKKQPTLKHIKEVRSDKTASCAIPKGETNEETKELRVNPDEKSEKIMESSMKPADGVAIDAKESKISVYTVAKPQWLGAIDKIESKETQEREAAVNIHEPDQFVDYKDRDKVLGNVESGLENAAPGLIIRKQKQKQKQIEKLDTSEVKSSGEMTTSSSTGVETRAEDAVALLLKHTRGYYASDEYDEGKNERTGNQSKEDNKKPRRVLGPERPSFLDSGPEHDTWVPPKGQSGDGRTSLNDRYGY